jgi:hypothetical protein
MKKIVLGLSLLLQISTASAQTSIDNAHRFAGFEPTVYDTEAQVAQIFSTMETGFKPLSPWTLQFGSECTERAETWTFDLNKTQNVVAEKVFVFYTEAYQRYYRAHHNGKKFKWWFHVSPYLLVKGANGQAEERVIDHEFSKQPQTMKDWTDLFIESKEACVENVPFANFEGDITGKGASYNANAHCYIVRAPMYDMYPGDIDARERGQRSKMDWDLGQVSVASKALTVGARKNFFSRTGFKND